MESLPAKADAVIIGGGIIGVSTAYYLAKKGLPRVVLLEKEMMGSGSTGKCAGGIRTQFSTEINIRFSLISKQVFEGFKEEFGVDPEFHPVGYLFLAANHEQWLMLEANAHLMKRMGLQVALLEPREIQKRWPFLKVEDLRGGSYTEQDGYAGPYEVLQGFAGGARRLGVLIREGTEVMGIHKKNGRIQAVEMRSGERIATSTVINAAGPQAAHVAMMAGLDLPVRPLRRQIFFTGAFPDLPPAFPMVIDMEHHWYMRREGQGLLLAGPQDSFGIFQEHSEFAAREWTAARSIHRVPILARATIVRGWAGDYEITPDHHAVIGSFPELRGFICATGFSGHGFMHSPAAGILVSELVLEGKSGTLDIHPLRPQRFREGDLLHEPLTAFRD